MKEIETRKQALLDNLAAGADVQIGEEGDDEGDDDSDGDDEDGDDSEDDDEEDDDSEADADAAEEADVVGKVLTEAEEDAVDDVPQHVFGKDSDSEAEVESDDGKKGKPKVDPRVLKIDEFGARWRGVVAAVRERVAARVIASSTFTRTYE